MKKVGIMTWFRYENYGTALQAYAIFNTIEKLGYEPKLINYSPKGAIVENHKITSQMVFNKIANKLKRRRLNPYFSPNKKILFEKFIKNSVKITEEKNTYPELQSLNSDYDAFVCGSDQIWSPICFDEKYFLSFVEKHKKKIAYAPSIGSNTISNLYIKSKISELVSKFSHLSVRENQGANLIKQLCGKDAEVVLDPTLLIDACGWETVLNDSIKGNGKTIKDDYIICYFLGDYSKYDIYVKKIASNMNMPVYVIPVYQHQKNKVPFDVGPAEFVNLIKNAKYVCTDSFHGIAFSINFNVPFWAFKRFNDNDPKNQNSRIYNILEITGLQNRLISEKNYKVINDFKECNFSKANAAIEKLRYHSLNYLDNALRDATQSGNTDQVKLSEFGISDLCCGCGACAAVCKQNAISIEKNEKGFEHYKIDKDKCIQCGICKKVCPFVNVTAKDIRQAENMYSYKSLNNNVLNKSSSGGIAFELAKIYSEQGYLVCGSAYLKNIDLAKHIIISPMNKDELPLLQGSKYIQSVSSNAFKHISDLDIRDKIIFFGTPCQVAGVDKLLRYRNMRENAILVDLICHGVPSYLVWSKYLQEIRKKHNIGEHPDVTFRTQATNWRSLTIEIKDANVCYRKSEIKDDFYAIFRRGLCYMDSCFECPYRVKSSADIRIGDYWGDRFQSDKQGVSMVVANTKKGQNIMNMLIQLNKANINEQQLHEYWDVQYPYNQAKPAFFDEMMTYLQDKNIDISTLRKKYCDLYDCEEYIRRKKKIIKVLINKVN